MKLHPNHLEKLSRGREKYQKKRSLLLKKKIKDLNTQGISNIGTLSQRDLFIAGIVLYWAEGFKHIKESGLGLATSDPIMAKFYIHWLDKCLGIHEDQLRLRVTANETHAYRIINIQRYWSRALGVPLNQFTKPFFQRVIQKKQYSNALQYHGVIRIHVSKSLDLLRLMRGWLDGVAQSQK